MHEGRNCPILKEPVHVTQGRGSRLEWIYLDEERVPLSLGHVCQQCPVSELALLLKLSEEVQAMGTGSCFADSLLPPTTTNTNTEIGNLLPLHVADGAACRGSARKYPWRGQRAREGGERVREGHEG